MPEKVLKTNQELLVEISKSLSSLHKKQDTLIKNLDNLQKELTEFKNSMPIRKSGWFNDYWELRPDK